MGGLFGDNDYGWMSEFAFAVFFLCEMICHGVHQLWLGDDALSFICKQHCSCYTYICTQLTDERCNLGMLSLLGNKDDMWNIVLKATLR